MQIVHSEERLIVESEIEYLKIVNSLYANNKLNKDMDVINGNIIFSYGKEQIIIPIQGKFDVLNKKQQQEFYKAFYLPAEKFGRFFFVIKDLPANVFKKKGYKAIIKQALREEVGKNLI